MEGQYRMTLDHDWAPAGISHQIARLIALTHRGVPTIIHDGNTGRLPKHHEVLQLQSTIYTSAQIRRRAVLLGLEYTKTRLVY